MDPLLWSLLMGLQSNAPLPPSSYAQLLEQLIFVYNRARDVEGMSHNPLYNQDG